MAYRRSARLLALTLLIVAVGSLGSITAPAGASASLPAGTAWSIEQTPNAQVANGKLTADSCNSASNCVAVGSFADSAGSSPLAEIWNGTKWRIESPATPPGAADSVLDGVSCTAPTACTAVGYATDGLGMQVTVAESWNGTSWVSEATPDPDGASSSKLTSVSCDSAGSCIAVGLFSKGKKSAERALAEQWKGGMWTLLKTGHLDEAGSLFDAVSCPEANACIGVGSYLSDESDDWETLAELWNGSTWTVQPSPNAPYSIVDNLFGVSCSSASACAAVGDYINLNGHGDSLGATLAESWNGHEWTINSTPNPSGATDIAALDAVSCSSSPACTAVGYYSGGAGNDDRTLAEAWDGTSWSIQTTVDRGPSLTTLPGVSCGAPAACFAVGYFDQSSGTAAPLTEESNGATWSLVASPRPEGASPSELSSVSCGSPKLCMAVGSSSNTPGGTRTLAEAWDGSSWSIRSTPNVVHRGQNVLSGVSCATPSTCVAVGESYDDNLPGSGDPLVEAWNGTMWTVQPTPSLGTGADLSGVSCASAERCVAVGYEVEDSTTDALVESWNGSSWKVQTVPTPSGGYDFDLEGVSCVSPQECSAVGVYTQSATLATLVEHWDGSVWGVQTAPAVDGYLVSISCPTASACTAVGDAYSFPGQAQISALAEAWNGRTWKIQKTPAVGSYNAQLYGVACDSPTECIAVGAYLNGAGVVVTVAEARNGSKWRVETTPDPPGGNAVLAAVASRAGSSYVAVGSNSDYAGVSQTLGEGSG